MADILTHYTFSRVISIRLDRKRECAVVFGTLLPDIISKSMLFLFGTQRFFSDLTHSLLGCILYSMLFCVVFVVRDSARFFWFMILGYSLHIFIDIFKDYLGFGMVRLFLPFSTAAQEVPLYNPFDSVYIAPLNILILCMVSYYRGRSKKW